jgi:pyruvate dehydrogenase E2 component (dihydrolipoamide acetyltransferase)
MAQAIIMPKMGQTVEEASIVKWLKKEGDTVAKGDILFEIETDKAVLEVESFFAGTLLKIHVPEGVTVPVNTPVAHLGKAGESVPAATAAAPAPAPAPAPAASPAPPPAAASAPPAPAAAPPVVPPSTPAPAAPQAPVAPPPAAASTPPASGAPARVFASPRARALARTRGVELHGVVGSGPNGRITAADVEAHLEQRGYHRLKITPAAMQLARLEKIDVLDVTADADGRIGIENVRRALAMRPRAMTRRRRVIARRLTESFASIPHFYVSVDVDMTDLLAWRQTIKEQGHAYTVTDFILESVVMALQEWPDVNSATDGEQVWWRGGVHLGVAVGLDEGLVVPVVRDAETLTLGELRDAARAVTAKARNGTLLPDEMSGSSFTVSNMGMMNVDNFNAIINPGESAILAVASARERAVPVRDRIEIRSILTLTLSVDHRIVDGKMAAGFINCVKNHLEDLELWKSSI